MMKRNLDTTERVLRFLLAFWWLGPWKPVYSVEWVNWVLFIIAWIALVESFFGWCWVHQVLDLNNKN